MADSDQDRKLTVLTDEERASLQRWLEFPEELPKKFWAGMVERASLDRAQIPVGQFSGITQYRPITVKGDVTFSSTTYVDLGLTPVNKSKGRVIVLFGWTVPTNDEAGTAEIYLQPKMDGETLNDANALISVRQIGAGDAATAKSQYAYKTSFRVLTIPEAGSSIRLYARGTTACNWSITGLWMRVEEIGAA